MRIARLFRPFTLSLALALFVSPIYADDFRSLPADKLALPVLIVSRTEGGGTSFGSGFYYGNGQTIYFVTAKHILFEASSTRMEALPERLQIPRHLAYRMRYDGKNKTLLFYGVMSEKDKAELIRSAANQPSFVAAVEQLYAHSQVPKLKSKSARLFSYPKEPNGEKNEVEIQLTKLWEDGRIKYDPTTDVVAVRIGNRVTGTEGNRVLLSDGVRLTRGKGIIAQEGKDQSKLFDQVLIGNDVFVFGYPVSISSNTALLNANLPLLRKGIVAGKNDALKLIILDCPAHKGNSGGLVIEVDRKAATTEFKAIGMITNLISFNQDGQGIQNSGYSVAIPMDPIVELTKD